MVAPAPGQTQKIVPSQKTQKSIERAVTFAIAARVPKDQLKRLFGAGYVPQPKQCYFHAAARACDQIEGPTKVGYGGARGGGKSVTTLAQVGADDCQHYPGLKWLLLRKVGKAAREGMEDLLRQRFPSWFKYWIPSKSQLVWPNQSRILVGHFNSEKDVDAYLGLEYDGIVIEEATQLSKSKIDTILTCLRTSKQGWRPRAYFTWNPGGVSHQFIKGLFVEPNRKKNETDTRFIQATVYDNAAVNPEYRKNLENLTGWLRKAWLEGDHDIAAGQFFTTWRHDVHVGSMGELPKHWPVWAAMDYGFTHPTVVYLLTKNDGSIYVVDEYFAQKRLPDQNSAGIKQMFARHGVTLERLGSFVAGDDVFANKGDQHGKRIADQYRECGIQLRRANTDRISGAAEILRLLGDQGARIEPHLFISSNCRRLIECIPAMQHDPHRPEDVLKVDVDDDGEGGDDTYDAVRYGVMAEAAYYRPRVW